MKRSIEIFAILIGLIFLLSSCSEDFSNPQEDEALLEESHSHASHRNCGLSKYLETLEEDPAKMQAHKEKLKTFKKYATSNVEERVVCGSPTVLPVAIHYQGVTNPDPSCLTTLAQNSIAALNQDYQGSNSDISTWTNQASSYFPGVSNGETCIEFQIANQNHPSGFGLNDGDLAVTINQTSGDNIPQFSGYINIVIQPGTGLLGYSPLGGNGAGEALVVDAGAFGLGTQCGNVGANAPFNLGRTLTHEMGHYLLLDHIWGNGCNVDDDVADTPDQSQENYSCPNFGASSCGSNDMFMNYMDYVNDACMYMFSAGQSTRMENYVASNLSNVVNNASNVIGTGGGSGGGDDGSGGDDGTGGGDGSGGDDGTTDTCESPVDGIAIDITETTATITWTEVFDANRYIVRYKPVGGAWKSKVSSTNSKTLIDLMPNTTYIFKLRVRCNTDGWQPFGPTATFETESANDGGGSGGSGTTVKMNLTLDNYGSETSWELVDDYTGEVIKSGGPYQDGNNGQLVSKTWSLEDGDYTFYIDDSYGDGICCDYGDGFAQILDASNSIIAESDGYFGYYDYLIFTVDNGDVYFKSEEKDQRATNLAPKPIIAGN